EKFEIPVIFRPAIRVCHAKQNVTLGKITAITRPAKFDRNPERWAATPKYRLILHRELNRKLELIRNEFEKQTDKNYATLGKKRTRLGIIACGVSFAIVRDILSDCNLTDKVNVLKITTPYPLPIKLTGRFISQCRQVLVIEETEDVIESQARQAASLQKSADAQKILGRYNNTVPREGELLPEVIYEIIRKALKKSGLTPALPKTDNKLAILVGDLKLPVRRPTLCPGCPHRASFYGIKKALPNAIYSSDIGCYTLGINLGAVDTCLDMGGGITLANGFYQAFKHNNQDMPIVGTIGDSTFYHAGIPALVNAVYTGARFVLVILDNSITAMTGMQPTPDLGSLADGTKGQRVPLLELVRGCGVPPEGIKECDPYDVNSFIQLVKEAYNYTQSPNGGMAVVIAKHPCPLYYRETHRKNRVEVMIRKELCNGCRHCIKAFECPALVYDEETRKADINRTFCTECGVCVYVCKQKAIETIKRSAD
ncbi:MAG: indolepyruvate ferredoxin oxidoreductase subunit alpha, partial [Planctomycetes bacterium]|nr:indolepyruvate ferredoxin oxidoreductase subunit alpha [Planctomycetota bacterium]